MKGFFFFDFHFFCLRIWRYLDVPRIGVRRMVGAQSFHGSAVRVRTAEVGAHECHVLFILWPFQLCSCSVPAPAKVHCGTLWNIVELDRCDVDAMPRCTMRDPELKAAEGLLRLFFRLLKTLCHLDLRPSSWLWLFFAWVARVLFLLLLFCFLMSLMSLMSLSRTSANLSMNFNRVRGKWDMRYLWGNADQVVMSHAILG